MRFLPSECLDTRGDDRPAKLIYLLTGIKGRSLSIGPQLTPRLFWAYSGKFPMMYFNELNLQKKKKTFITFTLCIKIHKLRSIVQVATDKEADIYCI